MVQSTNNHASHQRLLSYVDAAARTCHAPADGVYHASERYHDYLAMRGRPVVVTPKTRALRAPTSVFEMCLRHALKGHDLVYGLACGAAVCAAALPCMLAGSFGLGLHFVASRVGACIAGRRGEAFVCLAAQASLVALHAMGGALELLLAATAALTGVAGSGVGGVVGLAPSLVPRMRRQHGYVYLPLAPGPALLTKPIGGETAASVPWAYFPGVVRAARTSSRQMALETLLLTLRLQRICQDITKGVALVVEVGNIWTIQANAEADEELCGLETTSRALPQNYTRFKMPAERTAGSGAQAGC